MRADWAKLIATALSSSALSSPAFAQALSAADAAGWGGPSAATLSAVAVGAALMLPVAVPLALWQRWHMAKMARAVEQSRADAEGLRECLSSSPDGYYCWMMNGEREMCSRRLAVLLGLSRGVDSSYADLLAAFTPEDARALDLAARTLRGEGYGFEVELTLAENKRRVRASGIRAVSAEGAPLAHVVWMRDVSEGAAAAADLAQSLQVMSWDNACLRAVLDALPMPVWLRDEDLSLQAVNRAYAVAVDASDADAAVNGQVELASDDLVREARAVAARARAAGEPRSGSFHVVMGGQRQLVTLTEAPLAIGEARMTAGFVSDQTHVEELRAELDRHIAAHGEVLERLSTAIAIYTTDTRLTFFNTAFTKLWRLDREWLESQPTYGLVLDALRERRTLPEVADYRASKEDELKRFLSLIDPVETLLHLPDGRTLRRVISAHPYGGLIYTYEDVTDTLAMERSFNTAMAVQRETLDHLHEAIAVFGGDGRLKLSNPAFGRLWDLLPEDLEGSPHLTETIERLKPFFAGRPDRASSWTSAHERLMALVNGHAPAESRLERQDGTILDCNAVPLPDGATLLTFLDVTDTARVERALIERNEALAAADLLKSEFIANVSTEVAKPLTTIIGFSEMLQAEYFGTLSTRQHEYVKGISDAGQSLKNLVSDILDLAAIEAGQMTLELDSVDIHPMLSAVLSLVRERVREKRLTLDFDCAQDMGWIVGDLRRLKQVMFNLIGNAVKYTPAGGSITVRAEREADEMVLTVADTGPGIPEDEMARVFDSFVRVRHDCGQGGAGLGLALVRRFVELHGGKVDLKSAFDQGASGQGTIVTVRLPTGAGM